MQNCSCGRALLANSWQPALEWRVGVGKREYAYLAISSCLYASCAALEGGSCCENIVDKKNVLATQQLWFCDGKDAFDILPPLFAAFLCLGGVVPAPCNCIL